MPGLPVSPLTPSPSASAYLTPTARTLPAGAGRPVPPDILDRLRSIVGADHVLVTDGDVEPYARDATPLFRSRPGCVVLPATTSEVSQILKTKRVFVLKEEVGTLPRFFYYFDERYPRTLDPEAEAVARSMGHQPGPFAAPEGGQS